MFTDIMGYTSLMSKDEKKALKILEKNRDLQKSLAKKHHGEFLKEMGDGTLLCFQSALDAVRCGMEIQSSLVDDPDLNLRIGIHLGDIVFRDGDVFGDGVNIASRIENLAEAGGICISEQIHLLVRNQPEIEVVYLDEKKLKNVKDPVKIYSVGDRDASSSEKESNDTSVRTSEKSLAVLPFLNMSADPENVYFSDGITEDIITQLSKISEFKVISRTSSMRYRQTDKKLREIAGELGVTILLEGSVRRAGEHLRITAQLIDADSDAHLWAETYDRKLTDVFAIQSEVALSVASTLETVLSSEEKVRIQRQPTGNMEAYNLCLLGRYHAAKRSSEGLEQAIMYFKRVLEKDPDYAAAYAGLAEVHIFSAIGYRKVPPREAMAMGKQAALKALELDETLVEAHTQLGLIHNFDFNWKQARREFERAIELNPSSAQAHQYYAHYYIYIRDYQSALIEATRARDLDPLSTVIATELCWPYLYMGEYEKARAQVLKALEMEPMYPLAHFNLAQTYHFQERYDKAIPIYEKAIELLGGAWFFKSVLASAFVKSGQSDRAETTYTELVESAERGLGQELCIAYVLDALGRADEAMEWLEKAYEARSPMVGLIGIDIMPFNSVRDDPRFLALLKKMNLKT